MCISFHIKYLLFFLDFNETWISSRLSTNTQIWDLMKIHPVGAKLVHADTRKGWNLSLFVILWKVLKDLHKFEPTFIWLVTCRTESNFICSIGRFADCLTWVLLSIKYQKQRSTDRQTKYDSVNLYPSRQPYAGLCVSTQ